MTPIADGRLAEDGTGVLLTYRGLTKIDVSTKPQVLGNFGAGLGRGKHDHESAMAYLAEQTAVVGRFERTGAKIVRLDSGQIVGRMQGRPPYLVLPAQSHEVRLWAMGSGSVLTLDAVSWKTVAVAAAPRALAATSDAGGVTAVLGFVDTEYQDSFGSGLLWELAPRPVRRRLPAPVRELQLARLDEDLRPVMAAAPTWLKDSMERVQGAQDVAMSTDDAGRAVLTTPSGLSLIDTQTLELAVRAKTKARPVAWPGQGQAAYLSGGAELTILSWSRLPMHEQRALQ